MENKPTPIKFRKKRQAFAQGCQIITVLTITFAVFSRGGFQNFYKGNQIRKHFQATDCNGNQLKQHLRTQDSNSSNMFWNLCSNCCFLVQIAHTRGRCQGAQESEMVCHFRLVWRFPHLLCGTELIAEGVFLRTIFIRNMKIEMLRLHTRVRIACEPPRSARGGSKFHSKTAWIRGHCSSTKKKNEDVQNMTPQMYPNV